MDLFNRKKVKELQTKVERLQAENIGLSEAVKKLENNLDGAWCAIDAIAKFVYSIPQIKKCTSCTNFKTDKKQFPICDLCSKNIFEVTEAECQYNPR